MTERAQSAVVLAFDDCGAQAEALAHALGVPHATIVTRRFPDGETLLRLPVPLPASALVHTTLGRPNERLVELLLAARTARRHGVSHLSLVAPYLCYMRQDAEFQPGQAVSQTIVGGFLASLFDAVVTVDPHLHRIDSLDQAIPGVRAIAVSAAVPIAAFIASRCPQAVLVGPDEESQQWVGRIAALAGRPHAVCHKQRRGDRDVTVTLLGPGRAEPESLAGRQVVVVDDIASSGRTVIEAAAACRAAGAVAIDAIVTHALCGPDDLHAIHAAGIRCFWSSDTLAHASNAVSIVPQLAEACLAHGLV